MRKIREVLRLHDEHGASQRQIVAACRLPRTTVRDYLWRLKAAGLTYASVADWSDDALEAQLFPRTPAPAGRAEPDWAYVARELVRRGVALKLLWREHLEADPDGYRYTQFVARFREWQGAHKEPRLLRAHTPGEMVEIDYAGMTLSVGVGAPPTSGPSRSSAVSPTCWSVTTSRPASPKPASTRPGPTAPTTSWPGTTPRPWCRRAPGSRATKRRLHTAPRSGDCAWRRTSVTACA